MPRLRRGLLFGMVIVTVLAIGQLLVPGSDASTAGRSASTPLPLPAAAEPVAMPGPAGLGPRTVLAGVPMGYSHDGEGAKAAAAGFARAYGTLLALDDGAAEEAKRTMAASEAADRLVAAMHERLGELRRVWPVGAITYQVAPLAVKVVMDGPDAADAAVWYVGVVAARGVPTYEEWVTQTYRLVWERDDWRIAVETDVPGPRPQTGRQSPASPGELEARLAGFEAVP